MENIEQYCFLIVLGGAERFTPKARFAGSLVPGLWRYGVCTIFSIYTLKWFFSVRAKPQKSCYLRAVWENDQKNHHAGGYPYGIRYIFKNPVQKSRKVEI